MFRSENSSREVGEVFTGPLVVLFPSRAAFSDHAPPSAPPMAWLRAIIWISMSSDISGTDAGTFKETSLFAVFCFSPGFCFLVFAAPGARFRVTPPRSAASSETSSRLRLASSSRTVASSTSSRESLAPPAFAVSAFAFSSSPLLSSSSSLLSSCSAVTASKPCSAQTTPRFSTIPVKYSTSPCANTKSGPTARINVSPRRTDTRYKPGSPRRPEPATV